MENPYSPIESIRNSPNAPNLSLGNPRSFGRASENRIKTTALIYANPQSMNNMGIADQWSIDEVSMSSCIKGYGWEKYRNRCYDLGAPYKSFYDVTNDGSAGFAINPSGKSYGDVVAMFAGINFDNIFWGHYPQQSWLQRVDYWAEKAGRPRPKQGFYFLNYFDLNQAIALSECEAALQTIQLETSFYVSTVSDHGCTSVDIYEDYSGPWNCGTQLARGTSTVHTWELDWSSGSLLSMANSQADLLSSIFDTYYPVRRPDHLLVDNMLAGPNHIGPGVSNGAQLKAVLTDAQFRTLCKEFPNSLKTLIPGIAVWGNHGLPDTTYYTAAELQGRYAEFGFSVGTDPSATSADITTLKSRILNAKTLGTIWAPDHSQYGGNMDYWRTQVDGPGSGLTWSALKDYSISINAQDSFMPLACRTSTGFYAHYHPAFRLD